MTDLVPKDKKLGGVLKQTPKTGTIKSLIIK